MNRILVTGAAGFIGHALTKRLLADGWAVVGLDNLNDYYDVGLKEARLADVAALGVGEQWQFARVELADAEAVKAVVAAARPDVVVHLAAQASVRYGLKDPLIYGTSNVSGYLNVLDAVRAYNTAGGAVRHVLYASSSSVYGANAKPGEDTVAFKETDDVSRPVSLYAASKRADELLSHAWASQWPDFPPLTGLRFFTVYGPWGRPDMSPVLFADKLLRGEPVPLFNGGDLWRDFTFVGDIVEAIVRLMPWVGEAAPARERAEVFNLGNQHPVRLDDYVRVMAEAFGVEGTIDKLPWPPTEVYKTFADTAKLRAAVGWAPQTDLADGMRAFADWYQGWHGRFAVGSR